MKVADSVHVWPLAVNDAPEHEPPASANSSPVLPTVSTCTLLTVPGALDTTVTVIAAEVVPTGTHVGNVSGGTPC